MNTQEIQDAFQAAAPEDVAVVTSLTPDAVAIRAFDHEGNELGGARFLVDAFGQVSLNDRGLKAEFEKVFPKAKVPAKK